MRRTSILLSTALLFLSGQAPAQSGPAVKLSIRSVAPGIYVHQGVHELPDTHNRGEIANIGFIVGQRCVAIIDSGGSPEQGEALRNMVEATTRVPICYVINSHVHPDHIYGNIAFKKPGVQFIGHHKLAQAMAARAPYYLAQAPQTLGFTLRPEHFIPPDRPVSDTLELDLGERKLRLTAHPTAHTDNDLSIYDLKTETLWLADLLFIGHLPVVDGSLNGWLKEITKLKLIRAQRAIPGHGPVVSEWPRAVEKEEGYLRNLQNGIRSAIRQGRTMEETMNELGHSFRSDWALFDEFHKRNVSTAFAELEWEDD